MGIEWPIWWCLEPEAQAVLMQYEWEKYGYHLTIPPMQDHSHINTKLESSRELERLMRQPPRHQMRVV